MLGGGVRVGHARRAMPEVHEFVDRAPGECLGGPEVELARPSRGRGVGVPVGEERKPVCQEARADHQHPFVAQRAQPESEIEEALGVEGGHGHLQYGNVRLRVHHHQRHVRAVIEPVPRFLSDGLGVRHQSLDARRELGSAGRGVHHAIEALGETVEVVRERRTGLGRSEGQGRRLPMRRDDQHGSRPRQLTSPSPEFALPTLVIEQRRSPMTEVEGGHRHRIAGHDHENALGAPACSFDRLAQ